MHHDVFGEIVYDKDEQGWTGSCRLPVFAEYGRLAEDDHSLPEPEPGFQHGVFAFTVHDESHDGPTPEQANAFRYLCEREARVCHAVMTELVNAVDMHGGPIAWLQVRRESRFWGWLARLVGPEYKTAEDLKTAVRCTGLEFSNMHAGAYAYVAFYFVTIFGTETEHGLSVVFHPDKAPFSGDSSALYYML